MDNRKKGFSSLISHINPKAYANAAINFFEGLGRRHKPVTLPANVDVILTKACNLRCAFCVSYGSLKGDRWMEFGLFERIAKTLFPTALGLFICSGGEPFLYPRLREALLLARRYRTKTTITSNGTLLGNEIADWLVEDQSLNELCISFDGATKQTLERIRVGANFDKILKNIGYLSERKKKGSFRYPRVWLRYVVMKSNLEELPLIFRICSDLGLYKVEVKFLNVTNQIDFSESIFNHRKLADEIFREAKARARETGIILDLPSWSGKRTRPWGCMYPWQFVQIDTDGSVRFCYYSWRQRLGFFDEGFDNIWRADNYSKLRKTIDSETPYYPYCRFCSERKGFVSESSHNQKLHEECYLIPGLEKWQIPFNKRAEENLSSFRQLKNSD